jgi:hypothetical protein
MVGPLSRLRLALEALAELGVPGQPPSEHPTHPAFADVSHQLEAFGDDVAQADAPSHLSRPSGRVVGPPPTPASTVSGSAGGSTSSTSYGPDSGDCAPT